MPQSTFSFSLGTRVRFELGAARHVGQECRALGARAVLVVTDAGVLEAGLVEPVLASLRGVGIAASVFQHVHSNPLAEDSEHAAAQARAGDCTALLAIGGGSALDAAKGAAILVALGGRLADYEGWDLLPGQPLPVVAIPTTAGTGSEVSFWAVIGGADGRKMGLGSTRLAPPVALLDPELTYSLPPSLTAYTGFDALTHAIEAYTATSSNPFSQALAIAAVERIGRNLSTAVRTPRDAAARSSLLIASTMAAAAFNCSDLGAVHCMSETVGGFYNLHHGLANAILLAPVMAFNEPAVPGKYAEIAHALGHPGGNAVQAVQEMAEALGVPSLAATGVREADVPVLAAMAAKHACVPGNPRRITEGDFELLFRESLRGRATGCG
jgi:alcohol dehydrogenase